jgi:thiamine transport system ATP-binding protein
MVTHDHEEAFSVADRMAVMREGRVVQQGRLDEVWRAPVDAWTALFLGYSKVFEGAVADVVRAASPELAARPEPAGTPLAARRSALVRTGATDAVLTGSVLQARATPDQVRLVVDVPGVGVVDAVTARGDHVGTGESVGLAVRADRVAFTDRSRALAVDP